MKDLPSLPGDKLVPGDILAWPHGSEITMFIEHTPKHHVMYSIKRGCLFERPKSVEIGAEKLNKDVE